MAQKYNYILGLDMGVGSVGWGCVLIDDNEEPIRILDLGSRIFDSSSNALEDRRVARGTRRLLRRRKGRVKFVKTLFHKYHYLDDNTLENIYGRKGISLPDVYQTKLKGKNDKLSYEELYLVLVHYAKGRGFKSNRKKDENNVKDSGATNDEQKLLFAKKRTESELALLKENNSSATITNLIIATGEKNNKIRNTSGEYSIGVTREMIEEEVAILLDKQIEFGLITEEFKKTYMNALLFQRNFADGPDEPSQYHKPLEKMIGMCKYTGEPRAARSSYSYELFVIVQKLRDIRYRIKGEKDDYRLTTDQIKELIDMLNDRKEIKYSHVYKLINNTNAYFPSLSLNNKQRMEVIDRVRENPGLDLNQAYNEEKLKTSIGKLKSYSSLYNGLKKCVDVSELNSKQYDLIAECLSRNKSDSEIQLFLDGNRSILKDVELPDNVKSAVLELDDKDYTQFGKVSLSFIYKVLPLMIENDMDLSAAIMECFGKDNTNEYIESYEVIPVISEILEKLDKTINNKAVVRTIVETRKVVNAVIKLYGKPKRIHVEFARELTKSEDERKNIQNEQEANQLYNDALRNQIFRKYINNPFRTINAIKGEDLIRYKLFIEQKGIDPYTLAATNNEHKARINELELFTNEYEIDHIIPFSITHDDRICNKVLVHKKENQEKSNTVPGKYYENSIGYNKYENWIKTEYHTSLDKKNRLLTKEITDSLIEDYKARTINDTRYAVKAFSEILKTTFPDITVETFTGQITAKLRGVWGLNGLTTSYKSENYKVPREENATLQAKYEKLSDLIEKGVSRNSKEYKEAAKELTNVIKGEEIKNRDNHMHHAVDAVILAVATTKLRRRIEMFEIMSNSDEYVNNKIEYTEKYIDDNGEVKIRKIIKTYDELAADVEIYNQDQKKRYPVPYGFDELHKGDFKTEVILRAYEMNEDKLHNELEKLPNYKDVNIREIKPLFVSHFYSAKINGRLHKASMMGRRETEKGSIKISRMAINSPKFDSKTLEKIYDKEKSMYVYNSVKEWLDGYKNGEEAFTGHNKMLPLNKNGNVIKKVTIDNDLIKEEFEIKKNSGQYVVKEDVVQVHVYQRENDDKLYFVGMDRFRVMNIDTRDDIPLVLWFGQGNSRIETTKKELSNIGFTNSPQLFIKGQTVEVELRNGAKANCTLVGFTSGMLEVGSITGDYDDLLVGGLFQNYRNRYQLTVSTIKSIRPISVSVLGKISR